MRARPTHIRYFIMVVATALLLGACAVKSGDEFGITIEYTTHQFGVAEWKANDHCSNFGKRAVLARKGPRQSNYGLIPQTNVAEFDCVK